MYKLVHNSGRWGAVDRERGTRVPRGIGNVAALLVSGLLLLGQDNTSRDIPAARMERLDSLLEEVYVCAPSGRARRRVRNMNQQIWTLCREMYS